MDSDRYSMVSARKVLRSFLDDALRMNAKAFVLVGEIDRNGDQERLARCLKGLFYIVHTLKGTATMICGGEEIVRTLHDFEETLVGSSALANIKEPDWSGHAHAALERVRVLLRELYEREKAGEAESSDRGLLARASDGRMVWFPLEQVDGVIGIGEQDRADRVLHRGSWIQLWNGLSADGAFAVMVKLNKGRVAAVVEEVVGFLSWAEASTRGAQESSALVYR
jgi:hypothetical protein